MLIKLSKWLCRFSSSSMTLAALVFFVLFTALVLPKQATLAEPTDETAEEPGVPDLSFYYSPTTLYEWADAYGESGRQEYIQARIRFDIIWPLVYTFFLVTCISWLYTRAFPSDSPWQYANLMPLAAMLFDFLENISTSLVMYRFPDHTPVVDFFAPIFTMIKWLLVGSSMVLPFIGLFAVLLRAIRDRRKSGT